MASDSKEVAMTLGKLKSELAKLDSSLDDMKIEVFDGNFGYAYEIVEVYAEDGIPNIDIVQMKG